MNTWKHYAFAGIVVILTFVFIINCSNENRLNGTWIPDKSHSGEWFSEYAEFTFSGKNFNCKDPFRRTYKFEFPGTGTYYISNNQIEFSFSTGHVVTVPFSSTEETIKIGSEIFIRKR